MSDKEIIVASLHRVERRIRTNRLFRELSVGAALFLAIPVLMKLWDLVIPLRGTTVTLAVGMWVLLFVAFVAWRSMQKATLDQAASSADTNGELQDELKTAFWFANNPRPSEWVEAQMRRAAHTAQNLNLDVLYPRHIHRTSYIAAAMLLLFVSLNFLPLPWNHNWLALQAAPAFALNDREAALLKQTEELLRKAEKLKQSEVAQKLEDIVQQLQDGKIDAQQAAQMLDDLQSQLEEGNLDASSINEGLEEMAKDLQQSDKLEPTADAMQNKQLNLAQDELRKLAEKLGKNSPEASKEMQKSLQQAAENTRPGLEELAKMLKEAAENLKNEQQQQAQESLDGAAQELETIQQRMDSQQLKNMASQQIQSLKDSLQQRQQSGQKSAKGEKAPEKARNLSPVKRQNLDNRRMVRAKPAKGRKANRPIRRDNRVSPVDLCPAAAKVRVSCPEARAARTLRAKALRPRSMSNCSRKKSKECRTAERNPRTSRKSASRNDRDSIIATSNPTSAPRKRIYSIRIESRGNIGL
jgi:chemotaxis protein histidine kinase CheA